MLKNVSLETLNAVLKTVDIFCLRGGKKYKFLPSIQKVRKNMKVFDCFPKICLKVFRWTGRIELLKHSTISFLADEGRDYKVYASIKEQLLRTKFCSELLCHSLSKYFFPANFSDEKMSEQFQLF